MPVEYSLNRARRRLTVVWKPPVQVTELLQLANRQAGDGAWHYGIFADLREQPMLPTGMSRPLIEHIAELNGIHGKRGPVAMVVAPAAATDAQKYAFLGSVVGTQETAIFEDDEEAERWLEERAQERNAAT